MSCGMPCWTCGQPIPPDRHRLPEIQRVFCGDTCRANFQPPGYAIEEARQRAGDCSFCRGSGCLECDPETDWK
jgi:hypothetical protein